MKQAKTFELSFLGDAYSVVARVVTNNNGSIRSVQLIETERITSDGYVPAKQVSLRNYEARELRDLLNQLGDELK